MTTITIYLWQFIALCCSAAVGVILMIPVMIFGIDFLVMIFQEKKQYGIGRKRK